MRSFTLLLKFHISFSKKEKLIFSMVSLVLIITILLTIAFFLDVFTNRQLSVFENSQYDIVVTGFSKTNLNTISKQDFVKEVKPWVNLMVNDINNGTTTMPTNLMLVDNFDNLSLTYFPDKTCIKSNKDILKDYKQNPNNN